MLDKEHMEKLVRASQLDWTIVRPAFLTNGPLTKQIWSSEDARMSLTASISREDLAFFVLEQLESSKFVGRTPAVAS
jgi:uncharacterized protein YbjT (DUF2867 family)